MRYQCNHSLEELLPKELGNLPMSGELGSGDLDVYVWPFQEDVQTVPRNWCAISGNKIEEGKRLLGHLGIVGR